MERHAADALAVRRRRGDSWSTAALLACAILLGGCEFDFARSGAGPTNRCTLDEDCFVGMCSEGICVEPVPEALRVVLEVEARSDGEVMLPPRWRLPPRLIVGPEFDADVEIPHGVRVVGQVRTEGVIVPADVIFTRREAATIGDDESVTTRTFASSEPVSVNGRTVQTDFGAILGAGGTYDVTVLPTSASIDTSLSGTEPIPTNRLLPPIRFEGLEVPTGADVVEMSVIYPALESPCTELVPTGCTLSGSVTSGEGATMSYESDLQVRAIELETGDIVSSVDITESGRFAIAISPDAGPYELRISGSSDRALFPEYSSSVAITGDSINIEVPNLSPIRYSGRVETSDGLALEGARIQFIAEELSDPTTLVSGRLIRTVNTAEAGDEMELPGEFSVDLLPGRYDVIVTPAESPSTDLLDEPGILIEQIELGAGVEAVRGQLFVVPRRARLGVQVSAPDGQPLPLDVNARPLRRGGSLTDPASYSRSAQTESGPTGWFDLRLDVGRYDIIGMPEEGSNFAAVVLAGVSVLAAGQNDVRTITVGAPVPSGGIVRDEYGNPLANTTIRAYVIPNDTHGERSILVAETTSDEDGAYRVLLPSRLD